MYKNWNHVIAIALLRLPSIRADDSVAMVNKKLTLP